jgi:hypothetical protein
LGIFTTEEEIAIREFIIDIYVIPRGLFSNEDVRRITMKSPLAKHQDSEDIPEFNYSNGIV